MGDNETTQSADSRQQARAAAAFPTALDRLIHERIRLGIVSALAAGDVLSFNDLKAIEVRDLVEGMVGDKGSPWPDFLEAWEVQRVVEAIVHSSRNGAWAKVAEF